MLRARQQLPRLRLLGIVAMCYASYCLPVDALAADSVDLSEYFVATRVTRGQAPHIDLHARLQGGRLHYVGSMPDPEQGRLAFERLFGSKQEAGGPLVIASPDGRTVAFYHRADFSKLSASQASGVYFYDYDIGARLLHPAGSIVGIPHSRPKTVPRDVLSFSLLNVAGGWSLVPWAITLSNEGPVQFPLALLGATELHSAAYEGDVQGIVQLLDAGQDINARTHWGHTPFYVAIVSDEEPAAMLLAERGADLTLENDSYLHMAVMHGQSGLIEFIVEGGMDVNVVNSAGQTPLHFAAEANRSGVSGEIFGGRGHVTPEAAVQRMATLLELGANPDARTNSGNTALHYLAWVGGVGDIPAWAVQNARLLLDAGANVATLNALESTPLHLFSLGWRALTPTRHERVLAAQDGLWEQSEARAMLALLVSGTPDIDARNSDGLTPLQLALRSNHLLTAQFLVAHGADDRVPVADGVSAREKIDRGLNSNSWTPAIPP